MVDLDKFICSFISYKADEETMKELREFGADLQTAQAALTVVARSIKKALAEQGIEYKDGKLVRIQEKRTPVTIESPYGKETFYMTDEQKDLFESSCKKPSTIMFSQLADNEAIRLKPIDFDKIDVDAMVERYKGRIGYKSLIHAAPFLESTLDSEVKAYKKGLEDMFNVIKGK